MTRLSLIALGTLWIMMPVWMIAVIYLGDRIRRSCERQAEASERIARSLDGFLKDIPSPADDGEPWSRIP